MKSQTSFRLSRRAFLRIGLLGGIVAAASFVYKSTEAVGFDRWFRWMVRGNTVRFFASNPCVALAACETYEADVLGTLRTIWQSSRAHLPDLRGLRVVLKPNLVDYVEGFPCFTHPRIAQALIQLAREQGAREIVVAEGPSFRRDAQAILDATGYTEMLAREKIEFVDLNYDDLISIPLKGGYVRMSKLFMSKTICDADLLISMPKLKTHHWTQVSASIKNLFGIVPGVKYGWPKNTLHMQGIPTFLAELVESLPTRACAVVDGVVGLQGDGPIFGSPVPSGVIVAGNQLLAVDATCARLMGFDPNQVECMAFAAWAGLGTLEANKIEIAGDPLAQFVRQYERPPTFR